MVLGGRLGQNLQRSVRVCIFNWEGTLDLNFSLSGWRSDARDCLVLAMTTPLLSANFRHNVGKCMRLEGNETRDNNTLHTEPRAARLLETMMFAAAR